MTVQNLRLVCPDCKGHLAESPDRLLCENCGKAFGVVEGIPVFAPRDEFYEGAYTATTRFRFHKPRGLSATLYNDGAISLGVGAAFASEKSLEAGACADFQVRAYFFKYVTWDIGYRGFRFRNKANLDALSADMFVMALGASSKVMVAGGKESPFRWGVAAVAAFPSYYYDEHAITEARTLGGVKFKLDWIPMPDKDDWNSVYLQADLLFGPPVLDASGPVEWDLYPLVMLCAGFQCSW